ncbi:MAG: DUF1285 domain-containing protein [Geminicoccaceae bacterium]
MLPAGVAAGTPRDLGLRIAHDGSWHYLGSPIKRIELVRLFASVLRREQDGSYWLVTPVERGLIEVEDAPFVAVELEVEKRGRRRDQRLRLRTNLDQWVTIDEAHRLRLGKPAGPIAETSGPVPYVLVRDGLDARLARSVYYQLVEFGEEDRHDGVVRFGVWSAGCFFPLDDAQA